MSQVLTETYSSTLREAIETLQVALPAAGYDLEQDQEWVVVKTDKGWQQIRLHDYGDVYEVQGLYEKWIYDIFQCRSPQTVADLLMPAVKKAGVSPAELTVLDLGAGNGYVADVLRARGVESFVGVDIVKQAAAAAERDRPGLYADYVVADLTDLPREHEQVLARHPFNCLTCVAALGFDDIPPQVFAEAYNRVQDGGWVAFTIKTDFVTSNDQSGFSKLIKHMLDKGAMDADVRETFIHRVSTDGQQLEYDAFIGRKRSDIPASWL